MDLIKVKTTTDQNDFIDLPFSIYDDSPYWVPPMRPAERERFDDDYAFYQHSEAAFFLVRDGRGEAVGRVAVLNHRPHNAYREAHDALLYLYDAIDDDAVAAALFQGAAEWALSRGLNKLVGPKGFLTADGLGLLTEGYDYQPAVGVPYNYPYYVRHWEEVGGMQPEVEYVSAVAHKATLTYPERIKRLAEKLRTRRNFHVPDITSKNQLRGYIEPIKRAYNAAFANLWAYTPVPDAEMDALIDKLFFLAADPNLISVIMKGDEVIGFQFIYPDISRGLRRSRGRLLPFGWFFILLEKSRSKHLNINGNAILPQYQGSGANVILYERMFDKLLNSKYESAELVQIQATNAAMISDMETLVGGKVHKRHRVYSKSLK